MRWRLKGLETVESNNRAVTNAANGLRGSFSGELGRSAAARSAAARPARVAPRGSRARSAPNAERASEPRARAGAPTA